MIPCRPLCSACPSSADQGTKMVGHVSSLNTTSPGLLGTSSRSHLLELSLLSLLSIHQGIAIRPRQPRSFRQVRLLLFDERKKGFKSVLLRQNGHLKFRRQGTETTRKTVTPREAVAEQVVSKGVAELRHLLLEPCEVRLLLG